MFYYGPGDECFGLNIMCEFAMFLLFVLVGRLFTFKSCQLTNCFERFGNPKKSLKKLQLAWSTSKIDMYMASFTNTSR